MTALQIEYTKYVRKNAEIDGLLQAMLHGIVYNDVETIHNTFQRIHELDPIGSDRLKKEVDKLSTVEAAESECKRLNEEYRKEQNND